MRSPEVTAASHNSEDAEDVRLMQLAGQGDERAFQQLVERHQNLVVGTVARMLSSSGDVEDIAQQVFIRVWRSASRYVPRAKFTTWLLTITRNLVFNELRRRKRHNMLPLQIDEEGDERPIADGKTAEPDASLLDKELDGAIRSAIADLPETQRMAVILRRYEELSYEEIAEVLDQTVPAVKSLLFRARTELRARLSRYLER
jgi:RNA polymerase sigma-70 factor (ECF subfamily)